MFTTKPYTLATLPDTGSLVEEADRLVDSIQTSWTRTKTYTYTLKDTSKEHVHTHHTKLNNEHWVARTSQHSAAKYPYHKIIKYLLGADFNGELYTLDDPTLHTKYEQDYIKVLSKYQVIPLQSMDGYKGDNDTLRNWYCIKAEYELGAPLQTRQFDEFIYIQPPSPENPRAYVISLVADDGPLQHNVRGVYSSIERIELQGDQWHWIMCTTSDAGGSVPKWLQNSMISKSVAVDVPSFLESFTKTWG